MMLRRMVRVKERSFSFENNRRSQQVLHATRLFSHSPRSFDRLILRHECYDCWFLGC